MAARPYARQPAVLLTGGAVVGALLGWLARSRARPHHGPGGRAGPGEGDRTTTGGPDRAGWSAGPSPLPGPVPMPEGTVVDAPYTAEEPYTGRPRYGSAPERRESDLPGGTPP